MCNILMLRLLVPLFFSPTKGSYHRYVCAPGYAPEFRSRNPCFILRSLKKFQASLAHDASLALPEDVLNGDPLCSETSLRIASTLRLEET